uniref:Uncharacterized protein n=1 Tax=Bracon brevicornis TaxID=1563983 RepID=A0A6V7JJ27_9HYME
MVYRCDRRDTKKKEGGGVLIALRNTFNAKIIDLSPIQNNFSQIDCLALEVLINGISYILMAMYIPPEITIETYTSFFDYLIDITHVQVACIIKLGDFNVPELEETGNYEMYDSRSHVLIEFAFTLGLTQLNPIANE